MIGHVMKTYNVRLNCDKKIKFRYAKLFLDEVLNRIIG